MNTDAPLVTHVGVDLSSQSHYTDTMLAGMNGTEQEAGTNDKLCTLFYHEVTTTN